MVLDAPLNDPMKSCGSRNSTAGAPLPGTFEEFDKSMTAFAAFVREKGGYLKNYSTAMAEFYGVHPKARKLFNCVSLDPAVKVWPETFSFKQGSVANSKELPPYPLVNATYGDQLLGTLVDVTTIIQAKIVEHAEWQVDNYISLLSQLVAPATATAAAASNVLTLVFSTPTGKPACPCPSPPTPPPLPGHV
jgi:hypothetical protein